MGDYKNKILKSYEKNLKNAIKFYNNLQYLKAEPLFFKCYQYYKNNNQTRKAYDILQYLIEILMLSERNREAVDYIKESYMFAKQVKNEALKAVSLSDLGKIYYDLGEIELSKKYITKAYNSAKERSDNINIMISIIHLGNIAHHEGNLEDAIFKFKKAEDIALKFGYRKYLSSIYEHLATLYLTLNNVDDFNKYYSKALKELNYVANPREIARFFNNSIVFFQELQDPEQEYQLLHENLKYSKKYNLVGSEITNLINLSIYSEKYEKFEEAKDFLNQALELSNRHNLIRDKAIILRRFGIISRTMIEYTKSDKFLKSSLEYAKKANDVFLIIGNYLSLGKLNKDLSNFDDSYRNFTQALNYYRELTDNLNSKDNRLSFKKTYEDLPKIVKAINDILEYGEITPDIEDLLEVHTNSINACKKGTELLNNTIIRDDCLKENKRLKDMINLFKGPRLERDARELLRKRDNYEIQTSGRDWLLESDEIEILYNYECLNDKTTKTIEIDIYGKKDYEGRRYYILGECKNRKTSITLREIKCFILKVNIIANHLINSYIKKRKKEPFFHLIIFSLEGFPDKISVNELFEKNLTLAKGRILNKYIEMISFSEFMKEMKKYNMRTTIYKKLKKAYSD